ncbi:PucR family transcriptional regulator [Kitasatospora sp. NPDC004531]
MTPQQRRDHVGGTEVYRLVEELAESLGRSVALADPLIGRVRSSRHYEDADPARVHTVLHGGAIRDAAEFVLGQGVARWSRPGFFAGREDLGLLPRYCVPLRERGHLLGLLLLIAPDMSLPPEVTEAVARATPAIARELYADHVLADAARAREQELLLSLLDADPVERAEARAGLLAEALLPDGPHAVVSVVQLGRSGVSSGRAAAVLHEVVDARARSRSGRGAFAITPERAVLLQLTDRPMPAEALREQSARLLTALGVRPDASFRPVVGIGSRQPGLDGARSSYEQALVAVRAARRMPALGGVGAWDDLGECAVLLQLPDHALNESLLPAPLRALLESDGGRRLEETLRCYLDRAGSVPRTAEALRIHRTSLYYRLRQIQEITGLDLDNGADRITLHLGLRTHELLLSIGMLDQPNARPSTAPVRDELALRWQTRPTTTGRPRARAA